MMKKINYFKCINIALLIVLGPFVFPIVFIHDINTINVIIPIDSNLYIWVFGIIFNFLYFIFFIFSILNYKKNYFYAQHLILFVLFAFSFILNMILLFKIIIEFNFSFITFQICGFFILFVLYLIDFSMNLFSIINDVQDKKFEIQNEKIKQNFLTLKNSMKNQIVEENDDSNENIETNNQNLNTYDIVEKITQLSNGMKKSTGEIISEINETGEFANLTIEIEND